MDKRRQMVSTPTQRWFFSHAFVGVPNRFISLPLKIAAIARPSGVSIEAAPQWLGGGGSPTGAASMRDGMPPRKLTNPNLQAELKPFQTPCSIISAIEGVFF